MLAVEEGVEMSMTHELKMMVRSWRYFWQRRIRGWDDSETWGLSGIIAKFTLPRLKRFKELNIGYPWPLTSEEWDAELDDMIYALEICVQEHTELVDEADWFRVQHGLELFGVRFRDLWW